MEANDTPSRVINNIILRPPSSGQRMPYMHSFQYEVSLEEAIAIQIHILEECHTELKLHWASTFLNMIKK